MKTIQQRVIYFLFVSMSFYLLSSFIVTIDEQNSKPYIGADGTSTSCTKGDYGGSPYYIYNKSSDAYQVTYRTNRTTSGKTYKTEKTITVKAKTNHYLGCSKFHSNSGVSTYNYILINSKKL